MKNNRGITLVEIIVVIAIIAILTGGALLSTGALSSWRLNSGAKTFEMFYSKTRLQAMAKADIGGLILYKKDGRVTLAMTSKEEMNLSAFEINKNEVTIPSGINFTLTLEDATDPSLSEDYSISTLDAVRPANPTVDSGELNLGAINFKKGTGAQLPVLYIIDNGTGLTGEYYLTKIVLELKGETIVYRIEPTTGTYTKE